MSNAIRKMLNLPVAVVAVLACLAGATALAQGPSPAPATATAPSASQPTPSKLTKKPDTKPLWNELTPVQQHALAPLAGEWNKMTLNGKEKWLVIGNKFAAMTPAEQERMQERMRDWVKLTPVQRRSVRESYTRAKKLDADKKSAQWKEYQQLSDEQKKKLSQAKLPKHVAALPATQSKAAPTIQLPQEAREQTLVPSPPTIVAPPAAPSPAPAAPAETK
ncbi:hemolysin activation/secretion protein [Herbaspirillum sp. CF444]|uniref:DUF3106 domain-containing protein n=1 Tax=Herbaspirillum sp. CF444 TaxID=1144319 RepID=UPI0002724C1A|nr:DUF3106 domain-containing protein [Herbaspirillum sp. CF444]EJL84728.1 hemolysin activation/secretion protein [Herbaspirillum sp. CF444]